MKHIKRRARKTIVNENEEEIDMAEENKQKETRREKC